MLDRSRRPEPVIGWLSRLALLSRNRVALKEWFTISIGRDHWPFGLWIDTARGDELHIGRIHGRHIGVWLCLADGQEWRVGRR